MHVAAPQALTSVSFVAGAQPATNGIIQVQAGGNVGDSEYSVGAVAGRPAFIFAKNTTVVPQTPTAASYLYFQVDRTSGFLSSTPHTLYLTVTYYDSPGKALLQPQYDSSIASAPVHGAYASAAAVTTTGTKAWKTVTFQLNQTNFAEGENGGADFRLAGTPGLAVAGVALATQPPTGAKVLK